jgi:hypothetical protein
MKRLRFTLAQLMAVVLYVGFGFAALRNADELWASLTFTLAIITISTAFVGAFARKGRARTTWCGFAVFGVAYIVIALLPDRSFAGSVPIPWPILMIELGMAYLQPYIHPLPPPWTEYEQVSHSLGIILFGLVGAVLGRLVAVKDDRPEL